MQNTYMEDNLFNTIGSETADTKNLVSQLLHNPEVTKDAKASFWGQKPERIVALHDTLTQKHQSTTRQIDMLKDIAALKPRERGALAHIENLNGLASTSTQVRIARKLENQNYGSETFDRDARRAKYLGQIEAYVDLGWSPEQIRRQFDRRKIWDTFTPHPTQDKNAEASAEWKNQANPDTSKNKHVEGLKTMVQTPLTPLEKNKLADETQTGLNILGGYTDEMLNYLQDMQWAIDNALGPDDKFDLLDTNIDVAPRDWYAGDADGKYVPAGVLFSKRLQGAIGGVDKYLDILNAVPENQSGPLQSSIDAFIEMRDALSQIEDDPDKLVGEDLEAAMDQFTNAYAEKEFEGKHYKTGPEYTEALMQKLRVISKHRPAGEEVMLAAERASMMHKQVGIALGRQEIRHAGEDYDEIFDNLFEHLANDPNYAKLLNITNGVKLSEIADPNDQVSFFTDLSKHIPPEKIKELLYSANEGKLEGSAAEVLDRFKVIKRCFNHDRMGAAIIANARPTSCMQQEVIAYAFKIDGMIHTALNEELSTIQQAAENLKLFYKNSGRKALNYRVEKVGGDDGHPTAYLCVMDPASDSQKAEGPGVKHAQLQSMQDVFELGMEFATANLVKIGTGGSPGRGGFPAEMLPRLYVNELLKVVGDFKNLDEKTRHTLKMQISMVSTTTQGRMPDMLRGVDGQTQDILAKIGFEIDMACMVVDGLIDVEDYIKPSPKYSSEMLKFRDEMADHSRKEYSQIIRGKKCAYPTGTKETIEDRYVMELSATLAADSTNVSARKPGREDSNKVEELTLKPVSGKRAIGQDNDKDYTETYYGSWYGLAPKLEKLYEGYSQGRISLNDVKDVTDDEIDMRHEMGNAVLALAKADFEIGFDKLAQNRGKLTEGRWTVKMLLDAVEDNYRGLDEIEARHALIAYKGLVTSSHIEATLQAANKEDLGGAFKEKFEAAAKGSSPRDIILQLYNENDTLHEVKFGPRTKAVYPAIENAKEQAKNEKLAKILVHAADADARKYIADGHRLTEGSQEIKLLRHTAHARRSHGPVSMPTLMDMPGATFGARRTNIFDLAKSLRDRLVSNDNQPTQEFGEAYRVG